MDTQLLGEILSTLRAIEARVVNIELAVTELRKDSKEEAPVPLPRVSLKSQSRLSASPEAKQVSSTTSSDDLALAERLRNIEKSYLSAGLSADKKAKPELVSVVGQEFILPSLKSHMSGVSYMGSAYEYTTVPGKSDFDIQFFIKLSHLNPGGKKVNDAESLVSENPSWKFVKGGPENLLDEAGYLSAEKARKLVLSTIDKELKEKSLKLEFRGSPVTIKRSTSGPAITLNASWQDVEVNIDVVVCLKAADIKGSEFDLVAKPYNKRSEFAYRYWRISYSSSELDLLRSLHKQQPRKITLLRIMKLLKGQHAQLRIFPSYFYKNILFLMDEQNPGVGWERVDLAARFKDMIAVMQDVLQRKNLPLHFNPEVNYLADMESKKIEGVANFLKRIISKGTYGNLLDVLDKPPPDSTQRASQP